MFSSYDPQQKGAPQPIAWLQDASEEDNATILTLYLIVNSESLSFN